MTIRKLRAFTLVELLVVISIIGALLALLIPAIYAALRDARLHTCKNNHHQIGIALQRYAVDHNRFPGYLQAIDQSISANVSWSVAILPQLGHNDIYDQYSVPVAPPGRSAKQAKINRYLCPEDGQDFSAGPWLSYVINTGQSDTVEAQPDVPTTQRRAQGICHDLTLPERNDLQVDFGFISSHDGLTNTILVSENRGAYQWHSTEEYRTGFLWAKGETSATRAPVNQVNSIGVIIPIGQAIGPTEARLTSNHAGGAVAVFADGHVKFLGDNLDNRVYRHLCTPWGAKADDSPAQTFISASDLEP